MSQIFSEVQLTLKRTIEEGVIPTTDDIQRIVYGPAYRADSRGQRDAIYFAIRAGYVFVYDRWEEYAQSPHFTKDITDIGILNMNEVDKEYLSQEAIPFRNYLANRAHEEKQSTEELNDELETYAIIAVLWRRKLEEIKKTEGKMMVLPDYGKKSTWSEPTFWKWCGRERELCRRFIKQTIRKMNESEASKLLISSTKTSKLLASERNNLYQLEDGSSWACPHCNKANHLDNQFCGSCGKRRESV